MSLVHILSFNMGKSHHFMELFKNENKSIAFKLICVPVVWYNMGESLFFATHPAGSLFYLGAVPNPWRASSHRMHWSNKKSLGRGVSILPSYF